MRHGAIDYPIDTTALEYDDSDLTRRIRDGEKTPGPRGIQFMKKASLVTKRRPRKIAQTNGSEFDPAQLLAALMAFKRGDFSARLPEVWTGVPGKIADTFNTVIETNQRTARELERIVHAVGKEGR